MRNAFIGSITKDGGLDDRQIRIRASHEVVDRDGDVLEIAGCDLSGFQKNPVCLWQHQADQPVGTAALSKNGYSLDGVITFAPKGVSSVADMACGLAKAGIVNGISVGFLPQEREPLPGEPYGTKFTKWQLLEVSLVSVPSNAEALVLERSYRGMTRRRMTESQREARFARLLQQSKAIGRPPVFHGDMASYAAQMARHLEAEIMLRASATATARLR
jgi:HK97 family phage prohead protease